MPDRRPERSRDCAGHVPVCHSLLDGGRILASRGVPGKQIGGSDVDRDVVGVEGRLEQEVGRSRGDVPVRERHISAARYRAERVFEVPEVDPVPWIVEILVVQAVRVGESVEAGQGEIARLVVGMAPHQVAEGTRQRRDLVRGKITDILPDPRGRTVHRLLQRRRADGEPVVDPVHERLIALGAPCPTGFRRRHRGVRRRGELRDADGVLPDALVRAQVMSPLGHVVQVLVGKEMPDMLEIGRIIDDGFGHGVPSGYSMTGAIRRRISPSVGPRSAVAARHCRSHSA